MLACPARAFVGPRRLQPSMITLRGGSSDAAVAEATEVSAKELYPELVKKLETITHLGK